MADGMKAASRISELPWLFSAPVDLAAFLGSAVVSLLALAWGAEHGLLAGGDTPRWAWVSLILLVDVAHVYATGFRVYFDPGELRRRPWLYAGVPAACFVIAAAAYSEGEMLFWRLLAYLAVFHFVRQQYGWVALYRSKAGERESWSKWIDSAAIYLATIYPLVYWHSELPLNFSWFRPDDFVPLPAWMALSLAPVYWLSLAAYALKSMWQWRRGRPNPGKDIVVATTAVCWHVGIITFNSDYAFAVTNVVIHGVPYIVLVYWYVMSRQVERPRPWTAWKAAVVLLATIWVLAYAEELLWDRYDNHQRGWLFGPYADAGLWRALLIPALAVPQLTHYVLDGFIWRRRSNPNFRL